VTKGGTATSVEHFVHCHIRLFAQSTFRIGPDVCKNVSLAVEIGNDSNHMQSLRSQMCVQGYSKKLSGF
jgi:hypothetical protein